MKKGKNNISASPGPESMNLILVETFDLVPVSSPLLYTIHSYVHVLDASLGDIAGNNPSIDPYYIYLEDMPLSLIHI